MKLKKKGKSKEKKTRKPRLGKIRRENLKRGIYIIPGIFTAANIYCGYYSIIQSIRENYEIAAMLIILAAFIDLIDGRIARITKTTSGFGTELDSLADVISFGIAPALLVYSWSLNNLPKIGWTFTFIYVICGAIRLARHNVKSESTDKRFFLGLPIPPAAGIISSLIFYSPDPVEDKFVSVLVGMLVLSISFLMVSTVRYRTFKDVDLRKKQSWGYIVIMGLFFACISINPKFFLLVVALLYLLSGGVFIIINRYKEHKKKDRGENMTLQEEKKENQDEHGTG